jgi:hypothetical protein
MTPKLKAIELVDKMEQNFIHFEGRKIAIQHALIAVNEIIKSNPHIYIERISIGGDNIYNEYKNNRSYWQEVKTEIETL